MPLGPEAFDSRAWPATRPLVIANKANKIELCLTDPHCLER